MTSLPVARDAKPRKGTARLVRGWVRRVGAIYLQRESPTQFQWNIVAATALILAVPLAAGLLTGRIADGLNAALAGWLTAVAVPQATVRGRLQQYGIRILLLEGSTALGVATGGHLWAVLLSSAVLALCIPVRYVAATPLICLVIAVPGSGSAVPAIGSLGEQLGSFAIGCLWAASVMLIPFLGGRYRTAEPVATAPLATGPVIAWVRHPTPKIRFAVRLCVCFLIAYTALDLLHVPHASWALVGILTTLRPVWGDTVSRIVKRLMGMAAGCLLAELLLLATADAPDIVAFALIVVCGAFARPMRGFNYGYWPVLASPVLLLMIEQGTPLSPVDVSLRVVTNALGAALTLAAIFLIWPSRVDGRITAALAEVLRAHADLMTAPGHPSESTGVAQELHERALAADRRLADLTGHLEDRPGRADLVHGLRDARHLVQRLREQTSDPHGRLGCDERAAIAAQLCAHADQLVHGNGQYPVMPRAPQPLAAPSSVHAERALAAATETTALLCHATEMAAGSGSESREGPPSA